MIALIPDCTNQWGVKAGNFTNFTHNPLVDKIGHKGRFCQKLGQLMSHPTCKLIFNQVFLPVSNRSLSQSKTDADQNSILGLHSVVDFQYKSLSLFHLVCEMSAGKLLAIMTAKQSFSCYLEFFIQLKIYLFLILVLLFEKERGKTGLCSQPAKKYYFICVEADYECGGQLRRERVLDWRQHQDLIY